MLSLHASLGSHRVPHFTVNGLSQRLVSVLHRVGNGHSITPTIPAITREQSTCLAQLWGWGRTAVGEALHISMKGLTFCAWVEVVGIVGVVGFSVFWVVGLSVFVGSGFEVSDVFPVTVFWVFEPKRKNKNILLSKQNSPLLIVQPLWRAIYPLY